jgi:hypothetical protein
MENEAREILRAALAREPAQAGNLADAIHRRVEPFEGFEVSLPTRETMREPPVHMIILDTNVLSETLRPMPSARVLEWMGSERASALFITAITEAELLCGVAGRRRHSLELVIALIFGEDLVGRVLPF